MRYLIVVWRADSSYGDPELLGPFDSDETRNAAAETSIQSDPDCGVYPLNVRDGFRPEIGQYSNLDFGRD